MSWGAQAKSSRSRAPQAQALKSIHVPAPVGGINTVDPGLSMPATDCVYAYNLIAAEYGLRSRLGFQEWCTGLTGGTDNSVRSVLPFVDTIPGETKLFAATKTGIWDCTLSSQGPSQVFAFNDSTEDAGLGVETVVSTPAGRFLVYCDEQNGEHIYTPGGPGWAAGVNGVTAAWANNVFVAVGSKVVNGGNVYIATVAGFTAVSGSGTGPSGTGSGISDGTVTWNYVSAAVAKAIGPSLADQNNGVPLDVKNLVFVTVWKSRLFLVERNSTRAWYSSINSLYGTLTSFDFGSKMRAGGFLVGLYNWSYDAGNGMDTLLVGVSSAGDVVIYAGTDPNSASTFGLTGCWSVGGVPAGRRVVTDYGGDLLVLSSIGVVPLSKLVVGQPVVNGSRSPYATAKIANLFNQLVSTYGTNLGWAIQIHPVDNALLLLIPTLEFASSSQLAMSFATLGWCQYRDMPMIAAGIFEGQLYFGTPDGRVCLNSGYADNVTLALPQVAAIGGMVRTGSLPGIVTVHIASHGFQTGRVLSLTCADANFPSGMYTVTVTNADHFTYPSTGPNATSTATGTWVGTSTYAPVNWSLLTAFSNEGNAQQKQVQMVRLNLTSEGGTPTAVPTVKYNFDLTEPAAPPFVAPQSIAGAVWDAGVWDVATWGGPFSYTSAQPKFGATGMGVDVAVAVRGATTSRTTLVGLDVYYTVGGLL